MTLFQLLHALWSDLSNSRSSAARLLRVTLVALSAAAIFASGRSAGEFAYHALH